MSDTFKRKDVASGDLLTRFVRNKSGAFAMQFALFVVPLVACTGLAIDGGRTFLARYELESALDAAALAVGSSTGTDTEMETLAAKYVAANFKAPDASTVALKLTRSGENVQLTGDLTLNTYFMPLMGVNNVKVAATSEVVRGGANVEVALSLDVTESMEDDGKITDLKTAAKDLIDTVVADKQPPDATYYSKLAIVPWANNVHAGDYATSLRGDASGKAISDISWYSSQKTVTGVTWRNGTEQKIASVAWAVSASAAVTINSISKANQALVTTATNHGFSTGDYVWISGANAMTQPNNQRYLIEKISNTTFKLKSPTGQNPYVNSSNWTTYGASNKHTVRECTNTSCDGVITVTTKFAHGYAANDLIYIYGVAGDSGNTWAGALNDTAGTTTAIATVPTTTTFTVPGTFAMQTGTYTTDSGRTQECFTATCELQATTSTTHSFSTNDRIFIKDVGGVTGGNLAVNNTVGQTWKIASASGSTFILPGTIGPNYTAFTGNGTASKCYTSSCELQVTSTSHGIASGGKVYITNVGGVTGGNLSVNTSGNNYWSPTSVTTSTFILPGTLGPNYTAYTAASGNTWCLDYGCGYYRYQDASSNYQIRAASNCVTERTGSEAYTDVSPATAFLAMDYPTTGYNTCDTGNVITPLSVDKTALKQAITDLKLTGSTAGQVGAAWAWYMVSPNFKTLWPTASQPAEYNTPKTVKVVVLMSDGDFNTAHCNGLASTNYGFGSNSEKVKNCSATAPYTQAQTICTNMKNAKVVVYTVGFALPTSGSSRTFMTNCATSTAHAYLAENGNELKAAFRSIAASISKLRISK